jgi:transposase InsO family protein
MAGQGVSMEFKLEVLFRGAQAGVNVRALCAELEVSPDTYYRLRRRFAEQGLAGLVDRSRRPHRSPGLIGAELEDEIVRLRKELPLDNGAWSIRQELLRLHGTAPAESTIHRALRRRGQVTPQPQKRPKGATRRFEFPRPRDCWQIDISEWALADGSVVFIIDVVDDCSRKAVASQASSTATGDAVWSAVLIAFAENGLPGMFLTDNGRVFTGKHFGPGLAHFEVNLAALGIRTVTSAPYHPQTCGKIERFHQSVKRWLRKRERAGSIIELQAHLDEFRRYYNHDRPHRSLAHPDRSRPADTPEQRWKARGHGGPADAPIDAPISAHDGLVHSNGCISVGAARVHIGHDRVGQRLTALRQDLRVLVFDGSTLIADRIIDPTRKYQPSGRPAHHGRTRTVSDM